MDNRLTRVLSLSVFMVAWTWGEWNLPYPRPARYDYSALYSQSLNDFLSVDPGFFRKEMAKGWSWYKSHYIMSNGLVNHMRWTGTSTIGTNEAVSEGQGYGLILAVLNNDQATFNRIFEAANRFMWNTGKKSYFVWDWPSNKQGAATDADLDIGLALVFADELQKKGQWKTYSAGGISYGSRALEIIKSIRANMTSNDYLLPGDNWGGDGLNNLNPSYFATAWLKVFNAYQKEVDFAPVIDKCYAVLKKMPNYSKGQAADWVNSNGGQSSHGGSKSEGGMGMLSDGIRTPWRIAMDALWFNDPRAVEYCKNSIRTLTEYANTNSAAYMIAQMAQYTRNGAVIPESKGLIDNVAMWTCAILGSKDPAYSQKGLHARVTGQITGTSADYFGNTALKDDQFYYKQSLAMLGFATLGGQFPNILEDMKGNLEPPKPIKVVTPITANKSKVEFPGTVVFSASIDVAASWTLTLKGRTSGKTETFKGTGKGVSATWQGAGFNTLEIVDAVLSVTGVDPATPPDKLKTQVEIIKTASSALVQRFGVFPHPELRQVGSQLFLRLPVDVVGRNFGPIGFEITALDGSNRIQGYMTDQAVGYTIGSGWQALALDGLSPGIYVLRLKNGMGPTPGDSRMPFRFVLR